MKPQQICSCYYYIFKNQQLVVILIIFFPLFNLFIQFDNTVQVKNSLFTPANLLYVNSDEKMSSLILPPPRYKKEKYVLPISNGNDNIKEKWHGFELFNLF